MENSRARMLVGIGSREIVWGWMVVLVASLDISILWVVVVVTLRARGGDDSDETN